MRARTQSIGIMLLMTATCGSSGTSESDLRPSGTNDAAVSRNEDAAAVKSGDVAATVGCGGLACTARADDLLANCMASGACTKKTTSTGEVRCFDNGVKWSTSAQKSSDSSGMSSGIIVSAKKGDTLCFTKTFAGFIPTSGGYAAATSTLTIADGKGATIATADGDASGNTMVTCPGGVATKVDDACYTKLAAYLRYSGVPTTCTEGSCAF